MLYSGLLLLRLLPRCNRRSSSSLTLLVLCNKVAQDKKSGRRSLLPPAACFSVLPSPLLVTDMLALVTTRAQKHTIGSTGEQEGGGICNGVILAPPFAAFLQVCCCRVSS